MDRTLVIGTRGSALALAQASLAGTALQRAHPALAIRLETITTTGDARQDVPLSLLGRGIFVKELEQALLDERIDVAVHSAKDLPSTLASEFALGAFLPRADARDVVVSPYKTLRALPHGAKVGTSSPRRACLVRALRPDLQPVDVRGNIDTRLRKLDEGQFDALILAAAGLLRLGRGDDITEWLDADSFTPSVGQGALALETRAGDRCVRELLAPLDDPCTRAAVLAERAFLAELGAGCRAPAGAHAKLERGMLSLSAFIGAPDGRQLRLTCTAPRAASEVLGASTARKLLVTGGAQLLAGEGRSLTGKVVAITRPADRSTELVALIEAHGASTVSCPTIEIRAKPKPPELDGLAFGSAPPRWIAFASVNAVTAFANWLNEDGRQLPDGVRLASVGAATSEALAAHWRHPDFQPSCATGETLGAELPDVSGATVLIPRGDRGDGALVHQLGARGAAVREVVAYETIAGGGVVSLAELTRAGEIDAVVFASPTSIQFAPDAVEALRNSSSKPVVVCIGPTTAHAARNSGLTPVESKSPAVGAIVEALIQGLAS